MFAFIRKNIEGITTVAASAALALSCLALGRGAVPAFEASYTTLEQLAPGIDTTPADINPGEPAPTSFTDEPWSGGTTINISGPAYSAGLSKRAVALPAGVSQFTLTYQVDPSPEAAAHSQVNETDLIIVDAAGNKYNGSCQINNEEGGMWQIATATGAWVDTGFKPGPWATDTWTLVSVVYRANWTGLTLSVVSISDAGQTFTVPAALQNVPAVQKSGWQPSLLDVQIQDGLNSAGGSYTRQMRDIDILMQ